MRRRWVVWLCGLLALPAAAAANCLQDCARQGYERGQCLALCDRRDPAPPLIEQPGAPRNPYLDTLPEPIPKSRPAAPRVDSRCLDDCRHRGYQYGYCRKQCGY